MATDATGTPTPLGIPKYDTSTDAPSGLGFNAAMDAINTLLGNYVAKTLVTTTGDLIYASGPNTPARLPIGSAGQFLSVAGGIPVWVANPGTFTGSAAGGALTGTYPNPTLAANAASTGNIADGAVTVAKLASAVTQSKRLESGKVTGIGIAGQSSTSGSVVFGTAFAAAPVVILTVDNSAASTWGEGSGYDITAISTTGFTWKINQSPNSVVTGLVLNWLGIGA